MYQGCRGHADREPGKLSEAPPFRVLLLPVDQSSLQQFLLCQPGKVEPLPLFLSTWVADMSHQHEPRSDLSVIVVTAFSCHSKAILLLALIQPTSLRVYESTSLRVYESTSLRVYESTSLRVYESTSLRVYESRLYLKEVRAKRRTFRPCAQSALDPWQVIVVISCLRSVRSRCRALEEEALRTPRN